MNRLAFGAGVLVLAPLLSGCSNFYIVNPPPPEPTATPAPTPIQFPFDPAAGSDITGAIPQQGTPGLPTAFRVADIQDIQVGAGRANDPANTTLLLVLQPLNGGAATVTTTTTTITTSDASAPAGAGSAGSTDATTTLIAGTKDVNNPYRLAGIIVPGPSGRVGAGLQDADEQALLATAHTRMVQAVASWVRVPGTYNPATVPGATPLPTPTATSRPRPGAVVRATPVPTPPSIIDPVQKLEVYQDKQFPVDSENRRLVQILFTSTGGPGIPAGTKLSLNRMLVRSGLAVVDLYSPTSFDQKTWLLDEAYARHRRLGIWGLELNGKKLTLQQRVPPAASTGTGALSRVPVTNGVRPRPGAPISPSATQSPASVTPTIAPSIPRIVTSSGTSVARGQNRQGAVLPPASSGAAPVGGVASGVTSSSGIGSTSSNTAVQP